MDNKKLKRAVIAGASVAAKYLKENKNSTTEDVIKHISKNVDNILENIDD